MIARSALAALTVLACITAQQARAQRALSCTSHGSSSPALVALALSGADDRGSEEVRTIKVKVVIAALPIDEGEPLLAMQPSRVQRDLDFTNEVFSRCNTGLQLQLCGPISIATDPALYSANPPNPAAIAPHRVAGYITIFYVGVLPAGVGGTWLGDIVLISGAGPANTMAHEVGHLLGLAHTHDWTIEPELADGSNCAIGGDMLCDTPADPNLAYPGYVIHPCQYAGTVTDANGDLYTPMLNNVMSYTPCRADSLTPQQGAVMRYMLDSVLLHLRRTTSPITIDPFNVLQCANAGPITLSATPGPGTLYGPYVSGTTLLNYPNPPGETSVTYVPTTPPEAPTDFIDQYLVPNVQLPSAHAAVNTDSVWQSFQARIDADIMRVDVRAHAPAPLTVRMRLYDGIGPQGALLHDTVAAVGSDTAWAAFALPPGIMGVMYNSYTALLTADTPFVVFQPAGASYEPGSSNMPNGDIEFREWVFTLPPCQETSRYYALHQVQARPVLNLPDAYCHSDETPTHLAVDPLHLTSSVLLLDGAPAGTFTPAALTTGEHFVQHIYTLDGCTDTLEQVLTVTPVPDFAFPGLEPPLCTQDAPFTLTADPPGGSFRINGTPGDLFAPGDLGVGTHTIDYRYTAQLDTIAFIDQFCCYTGMPGYAALAPDSTTWQSFAADQSGSLQNIVLGLNLNGSARTFELAIHAGTGTGGPLLWSDTRTTSDGYNSFFTGTGLTVTEGSVYTFALRYAPDSTVLFPVDLFVFNGDGYTGGEGHVPGSADAVDHFFREHISRQYSCTDSTSFTVEVEVCTGIGGNSLPGTHVAPNPFNDQLTLHTGADAVRYALLAADGRTVREGLAPQRARHTLPVQALPGGCYLLRLWSTDGTRTEVVRVVRE